MSLFLLKPTTEHWALYLSCIKENDWGPSLIPVIILKDIAEVLSNFLSFIIDSSLYHMFFSKILKIQASLVHKKEDALIISNFSPISFLLIFSKTFKRYRHALLNFQAWRWNTYWKAMFKIGRRLFQSKKNYSSVILIYAQFTPCVYGVIFIDSRYLHLFYMPII